MITINGKTYRQKNIDGMYQVERQIIKWVVEGFLEEVKENKEPTDKCDIQDKTVHATDTHVAHSILEKLRAEITERRDQANKDSREGNETNQRYFEGKDVAYTACLVLINDILTSLETKKCDHVSDGVVYASNPPQYKCSKCGIYSKEFMPMETKEEGTALVSNARTMQEQEQPQFTPGQEIEVSNDKTEWTKRYFIRKTDDGKRYWCSGVGIDGASNEWVWYFARPLEQVTIPEFEFEEAGMYTDGFSHGTQPIEIGRQIEKITQSNMKSTLRNLINERCPELLELKMGCEILYGDETMIYSHKNNDFFVFVRGDKTAGVDRKYEHAIQILGTPPSWSDYLRCLGDDYAIDGEGNIWKYVKEYKAWLSHSFEDATEFPVVDLAKGPLNQSDEIIEKLVDLIPPL